MRLAMNHWQSKFHNEVVVLAFLVYDAFEHWKRLVKLLCSCEEALGTHKELFTSLICESYMSLVFGPH